jgi:hypothetical protein
LVRDLGGAALLDNFYNKSLMSLLQAVYPEQEWLPWMFQDDVASKGSKLWGDMDNQRKYL